MGRGAAAELAHRRFLHLMILQSKSNNGGQVTSKPIVPMIASFEKDILDDRLNACVASRVFHRQLKFLSSHARISGRVCS